MSSKVKNIKVLLRGHSAMETFAAYCQQRGISSRATVYTATNHTKYRDDLRTHRAVLVAAQCFLKETFNIEVADVAATEAA